MDEAVSVIDPDAESYKKINQQLVRKIHARNKKIKFLFGCIQEFEKIYVDQQNLLNELTETLVRDKAPPDQHNVSSVVSSDIKSGPNGRKISLNKHKREDNIFKRDHGGHNSISALKARVFEEDKMVRLPMISSSKTSNTENPERVVHGQPLTQPKKQKSTAVIESEKKKVYRVPAEKLVPLSIEEIKQRIQKRFR